MKKFFQILTPWKISDFLVVLVSQNSSTYPECFHSGSEHIHSVLEWIYTVPEYIHFGLTFLTVTIIFCLTTQPCLNIGIIILSYIIRPVGGTTWLCNSCTVPYRDIDLIWLFATLVRLCKNIVCPDYFIVALVILWTFAAKTPVKWRLSIYCEYKSL